PKSGEKAGKGTKVDYVISKGPETKITTVPALIGSNVDSAKNSLSAYNLAIGKIEYKFNENVPEGIVYKQNYNSGEEVEEQTKIDITISKGKEPQVEPEPEPEPEPQPEPEQGQEEDEEVEPEPEPDTDEE
ncbi:PASTA domain-containing protein, partial [Senegalia sp. (in: firmicutes)]